MMFLLPALWVGVAVALPPQVSPVPDWAAARPLSEDEPPSAPAAPPAEASAAVALAALQQTDKVLKRTRASFRAAGWSALGVTPVLGVKAIVARAQAGEPLLEGEDLEAAVRRADHLRTGFQVSGTTAATAFATAWVLKKTRKRLAKKIAALEESA